VLASVRGRKDVVLFVESPEGPATQVAMLDKLAVRVQIAVANRRSTEHDRYRQRRMLLSRKQIVATIRG